MVGKTGGLRGVTTVPMVVTVWGTAVWLYSSMQKALVWGKQAEREVLPLHSAFPRLSVGYSRVFLLFLCLFSV